MPEVKQLTFAHKEIAEALITKAGLHEGKWQLVVNFNLAGVNVGPNPEQVIPAAVVGIANIGLQKADANSPAALVVDAAAVNPASST